ncbi:hypothetical protein I7I53_04823 [Histoplasma capsulatum var. duboisii H88]|uniref:Uncharacterized protein n=1 Tax=Ajellomyces capsulatus (strain H88) TaxID=544711 RepID=A0A8A1LS11_AJEC8|nr:hypothetical protein I7I53_04823 [Histoplasma capsulatum var. duboisii H88]
MPLSFFGTPATFFALPVISHAEYMVRIIPLHWCSLCYMRRSVVKCCYIPSFHDFKKVLYIIWTCWHRKCRVCCWDKRQTQQIGK